jgi:phosphoenolpyruvate synthase/pyruvate phosphate dikinase
VRAVETCLSSATGERVDAYHRALGGEAAPMAVLMQRQAPVVASGVAFTADPVTGERDVVCVSAVRGTGGRFVSSAADADEWEVRGDDASLLRAPEQALTPAQARAVASLARRAQTHFGDAPQDIEWAFDREGALHLLQAVGTGDATGRFRDGDLITVDGHTGVVSDHPGGLKGTTDARRRRYA